MIVTDEEIDVTELLWVVVSWDVFCEALVILGVDFDVMEVVFVKTPGGVILDAAVDFKVVTVTFFETEETGVVDSFAVGVMAVTVTFFETRETGVVDGFTVLLEDLVVWLVVSVGLALEFSRSTGFFVLADPSRSLLTSVAFSSASTSSAPRISTAQPPRAPSPIVPSAGRRGLVGPQPRRRLREQEQPLRTPTPRTDAAHAAPPAACPPMTK